MKSSKALIVDLNRIHTSRSVKEKEKFEILAEVAESGIWREYQCGIVPLFLCSPSFDIDNLFEGTYFSSNLQKCHMAMLSQKIYCHGLRIWDGLNIKSRNCRRPHRRNVH